MSGHFCYRNRTFRTFWVNIFPTFIKRQKLDCFGLLPSQWHEKLPTVKHSRFEKKEQRICVRIERSEIRIARIPSLKEPQARKRGYSSVEHIQDRDFENYSKSKFLIFSMFAEYPQFSSYNLFSTNLWKDEYTQSFTHFTYPCFTGLKCT